MMRSSPLAEVHEAFVRAENERRTRAVAEAGRGDPAAAAAVAHRAAVEWIAFGPEESDAGEACQIVASYGPIEPEYAALRRSAGLIDAAHRGTVRVTGRDRRDFLNRMLTQELSKLSAGECRESFWLNRKGRIEADLLIVDTGEALLIDVDRLAAAPTRDALDKFLFAEEAVIEECSAATVRLSLHGPRAPHALAAAGLVGAEALPDRSALDGSIAGVHCTVARRDQCLVPGFELFVEASGAVAVYSALAANARPVGWEAYNLARIEGGTPLFRIDFGQDALPHETGVISRRVSFRKGCYLGQEIVARMESLGAPKQIVVGFRTIDGALPVAGAQIRRPEEPMGTPIGVITSSANSPLLGAAGIGFATVRSAVSEPSTKLAVHTDGEAMMLEVVGAPAPFAELPA